MAQEYGGKEADLLQALQAEEDLARTYHHSELQEAQIDALKRFYGDEYGDEVEGRSRVTTRELYETIQWRRPTLRRVFTSGDRVCEFEGNSPAGDQHAEDASDYINYVFLHDNDGESALDAYIFDGLLQRVGILAAEWAEPEYSPAQEVSGLNLMQAEALMQDPTTEILAQSVEQGPPDEAHPDGLFFSFKVRQVTKRAKAEVFAIAPEDFRIAAGSVDLETARYCGDVVRMMKGEAKRKWPDYAEEIDANQGDTSGFNTDERRAERFRDMEGWGAGSMQAKGGEAAELEIQREYIRHDMDGDGYPELIRCYRLGDCLLEYEEVDEHIYSAWSPIPIPHRFYGLSMHDEVKDLQRTKTVLMRNYLDAIYFSVVPRVGADTSKVTKRGLDALLTVRPGVVIETEGPPADALYPIVTPDVSGGAMTGMQWTDRVLESRTGVNRSAAPMDPDLLHDTARGVELLQNAQGIRDEEVARNLAVGLTKFFRKLYRLVHKHQNEARAVKIAGKWRNIDPRAWEADMRCTVATGLGTGAREKQIAMLQAVQADQVAWVQGYGPNQPYGPRPSNLYAVAQEKLRVLGFKNHERYLGKEPPPEWAPEPPPNPEAAKLQAQAQIEQAKLQQQGQIEQMKVQATERQTVLQAEKDMQVATAQQRDEMVRAELEAANNERTAALEAQRAQLEHQRELRRMQIEAEQALAEIALKNRELDLKERELAIRDRELDQQAQIAAATLADKKEDRQSKANGSAKP